MKADRDPADAFRVKLRASNPGRPTIPRRAERHQTNSLHCGLGTVLDVSQSGLRIACDGKPPVKAGQVVPLKLESNGQRIAVHGRVVWVRRRGLRRYQVGLQFQNVKASMAAAIESLALFGFVDLDAAAELKKRRGMSGDGFCGSPSVRAVADLPDYYGLLGVRGDATPKELQRAYRDLARKYHPDVSPDAESAERFIQIKQAYDILRDPRARKSYDDQRRAV